MNNERSIRRLFVNGEITKNDFLNHISQKGNINDYENDLNMIPESMGVYFIQYSNNDSYVGSSINIQRRIKTHNSNSKKKFTFITGIDYKITNTIDEARLLEANFIREKRPTLNKRFEMNFKPAGIFRKNSIRKVRHSSLYYKSKSYNN